MDKVATSVVDYVISVLGRGGVVVLPSTDRSLLDSGVRRILSSSAVQFFASPADGFDVTDAAAFRSASELPDGPLDVAERPIARRDVEHLRRLGAPAWMIEEAEEILESEKAGACSR
jgi:hypothetical protein